MTDISKEAEVYLIKKGGAYYRPNSEGYTTSALTAGRFTKDDAEKFSHPNGPNGPRDGMSFHHQDDVICENLAFHKARIAELEAQLSQPVCVEVKPLEWDKHPDEQEWYCTLPEIEGDFERGYMVLPRRGGFTAYEDIGSRKRPLGSASLAMDAMRIAEGRHAARTQSQLTTRTEAEVRAEVLAEVRALAFEGKDMQEQIYWAIDVKNIDALHTPESRAISEKVSK